MSLNDATFKRLGNIEGLRGEEVSLVEILAVREKKWNLQQEYLKKYSGCSLIALSINAPGAVKNNYLFEYIFNQAIETIEKILINKKYLLAKQKVCVKAGYFAIYASSENGLELKKKAIAIEQSFPIARLWDIDVFDAEKNIVARKELGFEARKCFICDNSAKVCARSRKHQIAELLNKIQQIALDNYFADYIANLCYQALITEVELTPKPGLVDQNNTGSHKDMDIHLLVASAKTLKPFFKDFVLKGIALKNDKATSILPIIRVIGIEAEKKMLLVTNNINTHKGSIFSLGLISSALGWLYKNQQKINVNTVCQLVSDMSKQILSIELTTANKQQTAGERIYKQFQLSGARGEAINGFATVREYSLPTLKFYQKKAFNNTAFLKLALLKLIAHNNDTNVINRGGINGLIWIKKAAKEILLDDKIYFEQEYLQQKLCHFDQQCIDKNISPGGSADLLVVTIIFEKIETLFS